MYITVLVPWSDPDAVADTLLNVNDWNAATELAKLDPQVCISQI